MSTVDYLLPLYKLNRQRTLGLLEQIEQLPAANEALGWRPAPGRAHIAWQLMHIGVTEEIFASERLAPHKPGVMTELWPRFRGGSTPDDDIPSPATIRRVLDEARKRLTATLQEIGDDRLDEVPAALAARKLTVLDALHIIGWHEAHHQGQAHITFNLYKNRQQ